MAASFSTPTTLVSVSVATAPLVTVFKMRVTSHFRQRDRTVGHLDLKSPNFLVDKNWSVKVADFGMAALKQHFFFQRGNQVGTPQ